MLNVKVALTGFLALCLSTSAFAQVQTPKEGVLPEGGKLSSQKREFERSSRRSCASMYCYTIRQGRVYRSLVGETESFPMPNSFDVRSVVVHQGYLISQQEDGKLWVWNATERYWIQIAERSEQILTDNQHLVITTKEGGLWVSDVPYRKLRFREEEDGESRIGYAENVFYDTRLHGVDGIVEDAKNPAVVLNSGRKILLRNFLSK